MLDGEDLSGLSKKEIARNIAVVPQTNEVHFAFTVRDMVSMGRMPFQGMMGGASSEDERIVDEAIERTGLSMYVDRHINTMSGGERQRVIIARAIAQTPKILLMDEPTSALDPIATSKIEDLAIELKKDYTVAIVTHNMQQASRISDYTGFMYLGKMIEFSETEPMFNKPQKPMTERYLTGRFG